MRLFYKYTYYVAFKDYIFIVLHCLYRICIIFVMHFLCTHIILKQYFIQTIMYAVNFTSILICNAFQHFLPNFFAKHMFIIFSSNILLLFKIQGIISISNATMTNNNAQFDK